MLCHVNFLRAYYTETFVIYLFFIQQIQDRFWNFIFYKFIFIFGVLNVQQVTEIMWWTAWFTLLGFFHLFTQLCKDRFEYVSVSSLHNDAIDNVRDVIS